MGTGDSLNSPETIKNPQGAAKMVIIGPPGCPKSVFAVIYGTSREVVALIEQSIYQP
jgi:hypothetical protein